MIRKNPVFYLLLMFLPLFISCTARISGSLFNDGQADLIVYTALEPRMTALIRSLSSASGAELPANTPVLDGPAISSSMANAPGVASVSFRNKTPTEIEGPVKISRVSDFFADGQATGFITFEQNSPSGGRCAIQLDLDSGPDILSFISPDVTDYLSTLMAPISTGEVLTKAEYLDLVASVYRRPLANEISRATIRVSLDFPGPVRSVKGGTFSGRRAEFEIPLLDILVLETPLLYEVIWR